jgi:CHAT domain-containing protein/Tfp pilus assembly protein PilF
VQAILDRADAAYQAEDYPVATRETEAALALAESAKDSVGIAKGLSLRAGILFYSGKDRDSIPAWEAAAAAWERCPEESRAGPARIEALGEAAALLMGKDGPRAQTLIDSLLKIAPSETRRPRAAFGMLYQIGNRLGSVGAPAEEKRCIEAALPLGKRLFGEGMPVALCRMSLGEAEVALGHARAGLAHYEAALPVVVVQAKAPAQVESLLDRTGAVAFRVGEYEKAISFWRKLDSRNRSTTASAKTRHNIGNALRLAGKTKEALEVHKQVLADFASVAGGEGLQADTLLEIGNDYREMGEPDEARRYYQSSLDLREAAAPRSIDVAAAYANLSVVYADLGDRRAALEYAERAVTLERSFSSDSESLATALAIRGAALVESERFEEARSAYTEALRLRQKKDSDLLRAAKICLALAIVSDRLNDQAQQAAFISRALNITKRTAPESTMMAACLQYLGNLSWAQKNYEYALENYLAAIRLTEKLGTGAPGLAGTYESASVAFRRLGRLDEAERYGRKALERLKAQDAASAGDTVRRSFTGTNAFRVGTLVGVLIEGNRPTEALSVQEELRAGALRRLLQERNLNLTNVPAETREAFVRARRESDRAASALAAAVGEPDAVVKELRSTAVLSRTAMDRRWSEVLRSAGKLMPQTVSVERARRSLPKGALYVGYTVCEYETYVLAVGRDQAPTAATIPRGGESLRREIRDFRTDVLSPQTPGRDIALQARSLYSTLLPREIAALVQSAKSVVVSPDGPLWDVPFSVLAAPAPRGFLGLEKPLSYTQSLTLTALVSGTEAPHEVLPTTHAVLALGDPDFGGGGGPMQPVRTALQRAVFADGSVPQLPAAREEAGAIARIYGVKPLVGAEATEDAVRRRFGSVVIAHLATHGYLHPDPMSAMSSGVLLARERTRSTEASPVSSESDGDLQAWEIMRDRKLKASLVVLSACETGRGEKVPGEGLIGLTRALQYAGAKSVVASQWKVADRSTEQLMISFHRALCAGKTKDEALREAMVTVRKQRGTEAPYYWAPFVLVGEAAAVFKAPDPRRDLPERTLRRRSSGYNEHGCAPNIPVRPVGPMSRSKSTRKTARPAAFTSNRWSGSPATSATCRSTQP